MMKRREFIYRAGGITTGILISHKRLFSNKKKRPNILFIMTDQQFAEVMSCRMGKKYINTPAMDSLAKKGMLFSRAYSANPLCKPVRTSIFTGLYPHQTGVQSNGGAVKKVDFSQIPALGSYFRDNGYDMGYVGKWHIRYNEKDKDIHGFDYMAENRGKGADSKMPGPAIEFLKKKRNQPFFLVVSFCNPHNICEWARGQTLPDGPIGDPPEPSKCPPAKKNLLPPKNETDIMTVIRKSYHNTTTFPVGDFTVDKWRQMAWAYHRMVEKVDKLIQGILDELNRSGLEEDTLILFISDHGDCHGAHGFNQKTVFYDESVRVPFILARKGHTKSGTSDKLILTGIDILPTLLDFAGIDIPESLPGASLKAIAEGSNPSSWRNYVVSSNYLVQGGEVDGVHPKVMGRMVRSKRYKYCIYSHGKRRESLVDMEKDPGEMNNLAGDSAYKKVLAEHRQYLAEHAKKYDDTKAVEIQDKNYTPPPFEAYKVKDKKKQKRK